MLKHGLRARVDLAEQGRREASLLQAELNSSDASEQSRDLHDRH